MYALNVHSDVSPSWIISYELAASTAEGKFTRYDKKIDYLSKCNLRKQGNRRVSRYVTFSSKA